MTETQMEKLRLETLDRNDNVGMIYELALNGPGKLPVVLFPLLSIVVREP